MATGCEAGADGFIEGGGAGWEKGRRIFHLLGGRSSAISGDRSVSQTKVTISLGATVHEVRFDVVCTACFFDFLERHGGKWGLVLRPPIYENDRIDPVEPGRKLQLDGILLSRFPEGYRHLAYLQTHIGYEVKADMPCLKGAAAQGAMRVARGGSRMIH
jgi:hypothetical protein